MNWFEELLNKLAGNEKAKEVKTKKTASKPITKPKTEEEAEELIEEIFKKK